MGSCPASVPAAVDGEFSRTALIDPHAGAVCAPVASFDAGAVGHLSRDGHSTGSAKIDGTEPVLEVLARASDVEARIPAWSRLPTIVIMIVSLIGGLVMLIV